MLTSFLCSMSSLGNGNVKWLSLSLIINRDISYSIEEMPGFTLVSTPPIRRRVSSVVEHSSANPKVPGSIPGPVSYRGHGL